MKTMDFGLPLTQTNLAAKETQDVDQPFAIGRINQLEWGLDRLTTRFAAVHRGVELEAHLRWPASGSKDARINVAISEGVKETGAIITQEFLNRIRADPVCAQSLEQIVEYPVAQPARTMMTPPAMAHHQVEPACTHLLITGSVVLSFVMPVRVLDPHRQFFPDKLRVMLVLCKYHCIVTANSLDNGDNNGRNRVDMWLPADGQYIRKHDGLVDTPWVLSPEMVFGNDVVDLDADAAFFRLATATEIATQLNSTSNQLGYNSPRTAPADGDEFDMELFWKDCINV